MLEWLKRHAWKACIRQKRIPSSNLGHSAQERTTQNCRPFVFIKCMELEVVLQAQDGDGLVEVLDNLETLFAEKVEPVLYAVFRAHADVGAATVHIGVAQDAAVVLVVGIGEAQQGIDGEGRAGGDDIVQVDVGIDGTQAVILEVVDELGSDAEAVHGFYLQLQAEAGHGVLDA